VRDRCPSVDRAAGPTPAKAGRRAGDIFPPDRYRGPMRRKRTRARLRAPDRDKPPDATGLTIDWLGIQATGSGGPSVLPFWFVGGLVALRAAPFVVWRLSRRLIKARRGGGRVGEPRNRS